MKKFLCYFLCFNLLFVTILYFACADEEIITSGSQSPSICCDEPLNQVIFIAQKIRDAYSRANTLIGIAEDYIELEENNKAEEVLSDALRITKGINEPFPKAIILSELVDKYIRLSKTDKALEITKSIGLLDSQNDALVRVVNSYFESGQYDKALKIAKSIEEPFSKALAFYELINKFMGFGLYEYAAETKEFIDTSSPKVRTLIRRISLRKGDDRKNEDISTDDFIILYLPLAKSHALIQMAEKSISSKSFQQAKDLLSQAVLAAKNIESGFMKSDTLARIAICYVEMKDYGETREIINSIQHIPLRSNPLAKMAISYVEEGDYAKSIEVIKEIESSFFREQVLSYIVIKYLQSGKEKDVFDLIKLTQGRFSEARLYAVIAKQYAQDGEYEKAIAEINLIKNSLVKIKSLSEIAKNIQKQKSIPENIKKLFCEVTSSLIKIEDAEYKSH